MSPKVSIIILNYNGKRFNTDCLHSVLAQSYQDFEIVFVDNASVDDSVQEVEELFQKEIQTGKIHIIRNPQNDGFAEGNNVGVRASHATDYIWLLNNDTIADKDALRYLVEAIEGDEKIGAVGSLVLDKGCEEITKEAFLNYKIKGISTYFGESAIVHQSSDDNTQGAIFISLLGGCSFLYKRNIVNEPFPEYYFAYAEDVFLSWIILMNDYKLAMTPKSIIHHYGGSTKKDNPQLNETLLFHGNKNQIINYLVFYKIFTIIRLFPLFFFVQLGQIIFNNSFKRCKIKLRSIIWILKNIKQVLKTRKLIQSQRKINDRKFLSNFSYKMTGYFELSSFTKKQKIAIDIVNSIFRVIKTILVINSQD